MYLLEELERVGNHRWFKPLQLGEYELSIQSSAYHYSSPRELLEAEEYTRVELAIIRDGELIDVREHQDVFGGFSGYKVLCECCDGQVYGYVHVSVVGGLYEYLRSR